MGYRNILGFSVNLAKPRDSLASRLASIVTVIGDCMALSLPSITGQELIATRIDAEFD